MRRRGRFRATLILTDRGRAQPDDHTLKYRMHSITFGSRMLARNNLVRFFGLLHDRSSDDNHVRCIWDNERASAVPENDKSEQHFWPTACLNDVDAASLCVSACMCLVFCSRLEGHLRQVSTAVGRLLGHQQPPRGAGNNHEALLLPHGG